MADIDYPAGLRTAIKGTKQIQRSAGFLESDPAAGASYTQAYTEDQPTFMSFDLRFDEREAMLFDAWQRRFKIFDQGLFFNFPIWDQYGTSTQEVRFVSAGVPSVSETGATIGYSGCQIIIPNYFKPDADFMYEFLTSGVDQSELGYLDTAINVNWPEA